MSWDVMIFAADPNTFSGGQKPPVLGDGASVRAKIAKVFSGVDWAGHPGFGMVQTKQWSIEFNVGQHQPVESLMLNVRGGGDPLSAIVKLCKENGWVAYDVGTEKLIDLNAPPTKSWEQFQSYRDQVVGQASKEPTSSRPSVNVFVNATFGTVLLVVFFYFLFRKQK